MRRITVGLCLVFLLGSTAWAVKQIPNGSSSQSITVVIRDAAGSPVTGITIANLDLYVVRDGDQLSAKTDLSALDSDHAAWSSGKAYEVGLGMYRIDIPDANLSDGVGTMLTYAVDDAVGANATSFYEVQLTDPWQTGDAYVPALAAQTAAEKVDTATELRTLLTGADKAVAKEETLGAPAGDSLSADVAAVQAAVDAIDVTGIFDYSLSAVGLTFEELCNELVPYYH